MPRSKQQKVCYYYDSSPDQSHAASEESYHSPPASQIHPDPITSRFVVMEDIKHEHRADAEFMVEEDGDARLDIHAAAAGHHHQHPSEEPGASPPPEEGELAAQSFEIGQREMVLMEMCVDRVVQEIEARCVVRMAELDRKLEALTQLCQCLSRSLETSHAVTGATATAATPGATVPADTAGLLLIQDKLDRLMETCVDLTDKLETTQASAVKQETNETRARIRQKRPLSPAEDTPPPVALRCPRAAAGVGPVIGLNRQSDYPDGSWLGDPNNPHMRVRCGIHPLEMARLLRHYSSAEKLAVSLLDHLFPRDVLAESNISGRGKHDKKQLDPLMVYGIYCHLVTHHDVTEKEWQRIQKNMDAKCRTMWRRKHGGQPLGPGQFPSRPTERCTAACSAVIHSKVKPHVVIYQNDRRSRHRAAPHPAADAPRPETLPPADDRCQEETGDHCQEETGDHCQEETGDHCPEETLPPVDDRCEREEVVASSRPPAVPEQRPTPAQDAAAAAQHARKRREVAATDGAAAAAVDAQKSGQGLGVGAGGLVAVEELPVAGVVEIEQAGCLEGIELTDFTHLKVVQMPGVRLLGGHSAAHILADNNVSLHEASARGGDAADRLQTSGRQFAAVIRQQPMDDKQQRLEFAAVND